MEVVARATVGGLQVVHCVVTAERGAAVAAAGPSSPFRAAASTSSPADCCTLRCRLGLAGSGLPRKRSSIRRSARLSAASSSPSSSSFSSRSSPSAGRRLSSASTSAPVSILQEENLFSTIDIDELEAETPALLAQCSDMDWRRLVDELHSEALQSVESLGSKALSLKALEEEMKSWIHDRMVEDMAVPTGGGISLQDDEGWSYESAVEELRMQANLQAAQQLAREVDDSFDWEAEVAELHRRMFRFGGAEAPEAMNTEQRLVHAWFQAQGEESDSSTRLVQEALASTAPFEGNDWQLLGRGERERENVSSYKPQLESVTSGGGESDAGFTARDKHWLGVGAALAASLGVQGASATDAIMGSNPSLSLQPNPESLEAASRAPSWLTPAILIFPVVSYLAFNLYRDRINPYAKVSDWMFSVVALVIVANIVLIATIGVRLY